MPEKMIDKITLAGIATSKFLNGDALHFWVSNMYAEYFHITHLRDRAFMLLVISTALAHVNLTSCRKDSLTNSISHRLGVLKKGCLNHLV